MKKHISMLLAICILLSSLVQSNMVSFAKAYDITSENPAVVIRTSYATSNYKEGWGGVFTASPIKDDVNYILYDVIIWENRINLYKFPNNLENNEDLGFVFSDSTYENLEDYYNWRESFCIASYKFSNKSKKSAYLRDAFISIFDLVYKMSPSENMIFKYSGHGTLGLCEMSVIDTKKTLDSALNSFGNKFALIDFGTNCQTSNTDFFQLYNPYTKYLLASEYNYGGYTMDEWDYNQYMKYDTDYQYNNIFKSQGSVEQSAKNIIDMTESYWSLCRNELKKGKIKQSMTLLDMEAYDSFFASFNSLYDKYNKNNKIVDIYSFISKYGSKQDLKLYNEFVVYYKNNNNENYFNWNEEGNGALAYSKVKLNKKEASAQKPKSTSISKLTKGKKQFKVTWKKVSSIDGYQIQYSTDKKFKKNVKTVTAKKSSTSATVKKLKSSKTYYVRVRTYKTKKVNGKTTKVYSSWSKVKSVKTK